MMLTKTLKLSIVAVFGFFLTGLHAQETVLTSGGEAFGSEGVISFSIGQSAYQVYTGSGGTVAEGVQQPFEISGPIGIDDPWAANRSLIAYPNPTSDFIILKVNGYKAGNLRFQLYDLTGKLLKDKKINSDETLIDLSSLNQAVYFLKVIQPDNVVKVFKIIKN